MAQHFNWLMLVPGVTHENVYVATGAAMSGVLIATAIAGRAVLGKGEAALAPASKLSLKGVVELILEFIVGLADMVIGEEGHKFVPMFAAIFLFVWGQNLVGLLP